MDRFLEGIAVVDIEATGLDTKRCSIISAGVVFYDGGVKEHYFECRPFRGALVQPKALEVIGMTMPELRARDRLTPKALTVEVLKVLKKGKAHTIAGQNPYMDVGWLRESANRYGMRWGFGHRFLDMHSVCMAYMLENDMDMETKSDGRNNLTADNIYLMLGMPEEPRPHNALNGARFEFEALCRIIYGRSVLPQFAGFPFYGVRRGLHSGNPRFSRR